MKVVKQISTGDIVHRENPEFADGKGKINAHINTGIDLTDLEEKDVPQAQWNNHIKADKDKKKDIEVGGGKPYAIAKVLLNYMRDELGLTKTWGQFKQDVKGEL